MIGSDGFLNRSHLRLGGKKWAEGAGGLPESGGKRRWSGFTRSGEANGRGRLFLLSESQVKIPAIQTLADAARCENGGGTAEHRKNGERDRSAQSHRGGVEARGEEGGGRREAPIGK